MDYSKLSDLDINIKVFKLTEKFKNECEDIDFDINKNELHWGDGANWHKFDPCNNPSDSWPIIVENKITTTPSGDEWMANNFTPSPLGRFNVQSHSYDKNPLRAAMIVYLMMQDELKGE